jgi:hypothetical protein
MENSPAQESMKEFGRVMVAGLVPLITTVIGAIITGINLTTGTIGVNWTIVGLTALVMFLGTFQTAIVKAWDKYTHLTNKLLHPIKAAQGESQGVIPF